MFFKTAAICQRKFTISPAKRRKRLATCICKMQFNVLPISEIGQFTGITCDLNTVQCYALNVCFMMLIF